MKIFKKTKKGFTLVELVVVIAVIAILAAVSVGAYFGVTDSANNSKLEQEAKQVHTAIQAVSLAPNDHSSLSKTGLTITHAGKFEAAIEENLGIDVALTDVQDTKDPTKPTIYFTDAAYSGKLGDKVYASFEYYSNEIGGKKAVADVVTGDCKATNTSTITEDSLGDHDRIKNSVTVNIEEYATEHSWENDTQYSTILADENITISVVGGANSGKYYTSDTNWRIYQSESPKLTIKGDYSITINSISVTYNILNKGVLTYNGANITSNDVVEIGSNNAVFGVGNTGTATNGQVRVTSITVDYIKNTTIEEPAPEILPVIEKISEALVAEEGRDVRLQGTVSSITSEWNGSKMNFILTDNEENSISVYALETEVKLGDILNVSGIIGYYMGSNQVEEATAEITGHDDSYDAVITSIPEALTKPDGTEVELTGEVVGIYENYNDEYDNISVYISDEEGNRILVFRLKGNVNIHDIITVKGTMDTYQKTTRQVGAGAEFEDTGRKGNHDYTEATCFEASTCTLCGDVNGNPLDHTDTLDNDGYCDLCHWDLNATTVSKTIEQLITSEEWTSSTTKQSFKLNDIVSVKVNGGANSGKAYTDHIRIYATDTPAGSLTISVPEGVTLTSVKISTKTDSNYAYLCVGEDTKNDISNVTTNINGTSVNLNTIINGDDGKQVRVTAIEVSYRILDTSKGYLTEITANPESLNFTSDVAQNISILAQYSVEEDIDVDENLVTWESNNESVATVSVKGLVTPVANGSTSIIATYLGVSVEIPVTVALPTQGGSEGEENPEFATIYTFEFGENGETTHSDGSDVGNEPYKEKDSTEKKELVLTNCSKVYKNARDAMGNSALKLGTGSVTASFSLTAPDDIVKVIFKVAGYKDNNASVKINGTNYSIETHSNDGLYRSIEINTSSNKQVNFSTNSSPDERAMIDSIQFVTAGEMPPVEQFTLTINTTPAEASIKFNGVLSDVNYIKVESGTSVSYEVSHEGYKTKTDNIIVKRDETIDVKLEIKSNDSTTNQFVKVTENQVDWSGTYLIVYEEGKCAFNGGLNELDAVSNCISVDINDGKIESTAQTLEAIFTIETYNTGYSIKSKSGKFIGRSATSNGFNSNGSMTNDYINTISLDTNFNAIITGKGGCTLKFNKASDQNRFRYYKSGQSSICLYKLIEA